MITNGSVIIISIQKKDESRKLAVRLPMIFNCYKFFIQNADGLNFCA